MYIRAKNVIADKAVTLLVHACCWYFRRMTSNDKTKANEVLIYLFLCLVFKQLDDEFLAIARQDCSPDGATCLLGLILNGRLTVANIGDSIATLTSCQLDQCHIDQSFLDPQGRQLGVAQLRAYPQQAGRAPENRGSPWLRLP